MSILLVHEELQSVVFLLLLAFVSCRLIFAVLSHVLPSLSSSLSTHLPPPHFLPQYSPPLHPSVAQMLLLALLSAPLSSLVHFPSHEHSGEDCK